MIGMATVHQAMQKWKHKFFVIWIGQAISMFASSIMQMAIIWYLTEKTGSAAILSLATFVEVIDVENWFLISVILAIALALFCVFLPSLRNCCKNQNTK